MTESKLSIFKKHMALELPRLRKVLPVTMNADKFYGVVIDSYEKSTGDYSLQSCTIDSVLLAVRRAAKDGLYPDGFEGSLIPRKGKASWEPGAAGLLKLVRNSGEISMIHAEVVHESDTFKVWTDEDGPHLLHEIDLKKDRGPMVAVYCIAVGKDGGKYRCFMDEKQISNIKKTSPGSSRSDSPWNSDFADQMWIKTAVKRLAKFLPRSTDADIPVEYEVPVVAEPSQEPEPQNVPAPVITNEASNLKKSLSAKPKDVTQQYINSSQAKLPAKKEDSIPI
jgi:recombination protein RecT